MITGFWANVTHIYSSGANVQKLKFSFHLMIIFCLLYVWDMGILPHFSSHDL